MKNELLLMSGADIPFTGGRAIIHQPTLKEISFLGEKAFFIGCGFLNFSKDLLANKDKLHLENYTDFDIFMSLVINRAPEARKSIDCGLDVLQLIFPDYTIEVRENRIELHKEGQDGYIDKDNYSELKDIIVSMFDLVPAKDDPKQYNPKGDMAARIAEKFVKRQEKLSKLKLNSKSSDDDIRILSRYASILAVGLQLDLNNIMQYTVYQLYNKFQRFQLKMQWDAYIQARLAGAKDLEEVDNWEIDLLEKDQNKKTSKNKK